MDLPPPISDSVLNTLLAPALSSLASDLNTTPAQLADSLSSPELTDTLAAIITNLEALEHIRALAARAPATAACRALLTTDDPIEQRRVAATLLRTPIHRPNRASTHQRSRRASERPDNYPRAHTQSARSIQQTGHATPHLPSPDPDHPANLSGDLESLLSLLLTPTPVAEAAPTAPQPPPPPPSPSPTPPPGRTPPAPGKHVPPFEPTAPAPTRPGTTPLPLNLPPAPTLHRRTPPTRAASLLTAAASSPQPTARPP